MNKLKAITRSVSFKPSASTSNKNNRHEKDKTEAVVGFKLTLHESSSEAACGMEKYLKILCSFENFLMNLDNFLKAQSLKYN